MQGVEIGHCNAAIRAALMGNCALMECTVKEILEPVGTYGKGDTLGLDARPEIEIVKAMRAHDDNAIVVTEEIGSKGLVFTHALDPAALRTTYISDPTDRSAFLRRFLAEVPDKTVKFHQVVSDTHTKPEWERMAGSPAVITGAFSAITCIRHAVPIFSVLVNYITQDLFVSCRAGNFMLTIPASWEAVDYHYITHRGLRLEFPPLEHPFNGDEHRFVTFVGKEGYLENLVDSKLMSKERVTESLHYNEPGGPSRIFYLSTLQPRDKPVGFVLANGEKIGEWIHWVPWISFARQSEDHSAPALKLFEIYRKDQVRMKGDVLMSTPPFYSVFRKHDSRAGRMLMDIQRFADFDNPSKIRATLIACPAGNAWATGVVNQFGYRQVSFPGGLADVD